MASIDKLISNGKALQRERRATPSVDVWLASVRTALVAEFGVEGASLGRFEDIVSESERTTPFAEQQWQRQQTIVREALAHLEQLDTKSRRTASRIAISDWPSAHGHAVFISHSGESAAFGRLVRFIAACGLRPMIAEHQAFRGETVPQHVRQVIAGCSSAVIFAENDGTTSSRPGPGLLVEAGILQERFADRVVLLVEEGVQLGAMLTPYAFTRFDSSCLETVFERLMLEFVAQGSLRASTSEGGNDGVLHHKP